MNKISTHTTEELGTMIRDEENKVRSFDLKLAGGAIKNVKEKKNARKTVARILTELNKRARA